MQAQISLASESFDELAAHLRHPAPRPVTLVMTVTDNLSVSQDGLLFIDESLDTTVTDVYWSLPIK